MRALDEGHPIVIPTDTVYGIAARPDRPDAIASIFRAKGRPPEKPLPVLGARVEDLHAVVVLSPDAMRLAKVFWPGPLTLVLARAPGFDHDLGGTERGTIGVRVPRSEVARSLLAQSGPLAVTSANASGEPPARTVDEARVALGKVPAVFVDGGVCDGTSSTVALLGPEVTILRAGPIGQAELDQILMS